MAKIPLTQAVLLVGAFDASGFADELHIDPMAATKPVTTLASGGFVQLAVGLQSGTVKINGFNDYALTTLDQYIGVVGSQYAVSASTPGATAGDPAHFTRGVFNQWTPLLGKVGDVARFAAHLNLDGLAEVRGFTMAPIAARIATGTGVGVTFPGPTAAQKLYGAIHITAVAGSASPTLTATIQSDTTNGFGAPTTRMSFTAATAAGWQMPVPVAGPITDTWWRVIWTISGTTPSFTFAVVLGVD